MTQPFVPPTPEPRASGVDAVWVTPPRQALDAPVFFNPEPAVLRWKALRGAIVSRIISLVLSLAIWGVLWWIMRDDLWQGFWWVAGISVALSVTLLVVTIVRAVLARKALGRLHEGLALGIGRGGLFLDGYLPWTHLATIEACPPGLRGSVRLVITSTEGVERELPLEWLSHSPASVDNAVRTLSAERFGLDLRVFDERVRRPRVRRTTTAEPAASGV